MATIIRDGKIRDGNTGRSIGSWQKEQVRGLFEPDLPPVEATCHGKPMKWVFLIGGQPQDIDYKVLRVEIDTPEEAGRISHVVECEECGERRLYKNTPLWQKWLKQQQEGLEALAALHGEDDSGMNASDIVFSGSIYTENRRKMGKLTGIK